VQNARRLLLTDLVFGVSALEDSKIAVIRRIIHWELAAIVAILLCAALMARGVGYVAPDPAGSRVPPRIHS
jgi:uncharacterized membrane protein